MNELSLAYNFIIGLFQSNPLVNTISTANSIEIDNNKENIYPLVNINLTESDIAETQLNIFSFEITVVQQRDKRPVLTNSKLLDESNYIDNMNETHSICRRFVNVLEGQLNDLNIEVDSISSLTPLKDWNKNGLDGFRFTIDLSIPNLGESC